MADPHKLRHKLDLLSDLKLLFGQRKLAVYLYKATALQWKRNTGIGLFSPFVSVLIHVLLLGAVLSVVLESDLPSYVSYFAMSFATWQSISGSITRSATANERAERFYEFPYTSSLLIFGIDSVEVIAGFAQRIAAAAIILFAFNLPVALTPYWLVSALGIILLTIMAASWSLTIALVFDGFRILRGLLPQIMYALFLLTPILWKRERLGDLQWVADFNPFFHFVEVVRSPVLTHSMPVMSFIVVLVSTVIGATLSALLYERNKRIIAFRWLA